jgi:hypothetical protein
MFEITPDDIALLGDGDLRSLVGLLCESEVRRRGFPTSSVTWGGHQNAADGGLDVRVMLPATAAIDGFVPRPATGFQVKKQGMPRAEILAEMRPDGTIRPVMQELADNSGAYIIVSSTGSTSDSVLRDRRAAMAEAVRGLPNADALGLDFYDRTRLATWVREHPNIILWLREKIGKAIRGWRPYGAWAYEPDGINGDYLQDNSPRIQTGQRETDRGIPAHEGIKRIRNRLNVSGQIARLVGLSGVGKTRFAQALFDARVGERILDSSLAIYTNMADDPDPQPVGLASDLVVAKTRAILVVDNCTPDLHRRLSELCRSPESTVSMLTIEYDIREDQPEGTEVFRLEPSSNELIQKLLKRRFPALSAIDARRVADFSDGNARIAIALAGAVGNETIAGLNDAELFQRLFQQRHEPNESLLLVAQACSLVYSFQGEDVSDNDQAELRRLGAMVAKDPHEMFRGIAELRRRDLVQHRSVWRSVMPQAIANRLAATALQNIPLATIQAQLVNGSTERLMKTFARRLVYLHASDESNAIVRRWLAPDGLLGYVAVLNVLGRSMFVYVAPVAPDDTLSALERVLLDPEADAALRRCKHYIYLLCLLAYDATMFARCTTLIMKFAEATEGSNTSDKTRAFASLFVLYLSGTHATIEQRLSVVHPLLVSGHAHQRDFGLAALKAALEVDHFFSSHNFEFGARSRDYGFWQSTKDDVKHWYGLMLQLVGTLACSDGPSAPLVRGGLAEKFSGLWAKAGMYDELEVVCRAIAQKQFWPDGWIAVHRTRHFFSKDFTPEVSQRLARLERLLRPSNLVQEVKSIVLINTTAALDLEDDGVEDMQTRIERRETRAESLGKAVAANEAALGDLLPELVSGEGHLWSFGRGLVEGGEDPNALWMRLVSEAAIIPQTKRRPDIFRGFLHALHTKNPELTEILLDDAVEGETLCPWYPILQTAVGIDQRGVNRLLRSLVIGKAPLWMYRNLAFGRATDPVSGSDFKKLIDEIASKAEGFDVATEILWMRLHSDKNRAHGHLPEIIEAGRGLMGQIKFTTRNDLKDYHLAEVVRICLSGEAGAAIVEGICRKMRGSILKYETHASAHDDLLQALFSVQPIAALDGLFWEDTTGLSLGLSILADVRPRKNLFDHVPEGELLAWCDRDPRSRYPAIAAVITIAHPTQENEPRQWTSIALRLLEKAPDRIEVLRHFVQGFIPMSWSGSRTAIMASNAKLLYELDAYPDLPLWSL